MMGSSASDLKRRKALAWTAFWKLEHLWKSPTIPISTKVKLFDTTCVTVLLYGCESWVISKDMENKINSFGTSCYRIMLNIKRVDRVPNTTIYNLTETTPLVVRARIRQLKFIGHMIYYACQMMSLLKSMHCMSQVMVKGNPEDNRLYSRNTSNVLWEIWTACWIMVNYQPWPMTAVAGGNLWSPAPQPNDDDDDDDACTVITDFNFQSLNVDSQQSEACKSYPVLPWATPQNMAISDLAFYYTL